MVMGSLWSVMGHYGAVMGWLWGGHMQGCHRWVVWVLRLWGGYGVVMGHYGALWGGDGALWGSPTSRCAPQVRVWVFPEGTRNHSGSMLPFKRGAFHLAVQAQVPVVPIVISSYQHFYSKRERRFTAGECVIQVLPPLPTRGLGPADVPALTERVRAAMLDAFEALSAELRPPAAPATPGDHRSDRQSDPQSDPRNDPWSDPQSDPHSPTATPSNHWSDHRSDPRNDPQSDPWSDQHSPTATQSDPQRPTEPWGDPQYPAVPQSDPRSDPRVTPGVTPGVTASPARWGPRSDPRPCSPTAVGQGLTPKWGQTDPQVGHGLTPKCGHN
uniref:1-acylglycerol-3-phosphate O-acyltransferase n=1 Tax=Geospiza parvula TaxID=87175 RepID=A0A8U8BDF0_GEOPR